MLDARQQSTTTYPVAFFMTSSTDHIAGATGLSPTVTISKNGGTFAAVAGAVTEIGNGWYSLAGNATDRNTLGELLIHATATGADPTERAIEIIAGDPFGAMFGLDSGTGVKVGSYAVSQDPATIIYGVTPGSYNSTGTMGAYFNAINAAAAKLTFDGSNNLHAIVYAYNSGQAPDSLVWGYTNAAPTTGTMGHSNVNNIVAGYASTFAPDYMVWNALTASYAGVGSFGAKVTALANASDPWTLDVRTAYTSTQAGYFLNAINTAAGKLTFDGANAVRSHVYVYESGQSPEVLVWGASGTTYDAAGTMGGELADASVGGGGGSGSDPWATVLPGSYPTGQAGNMLSAINNAAAKLTFDASNNVYSIPQAYGSGMTPEGRVWGYTNAAPTTATMGYSNVNPIVAGYASGQTPAASTWGALLASYTTTNTMGARMNALGGDPWAATLGGYPTGQAGNLLNIMAGRVDASITGIPTALMAYTISPGVTMYQAMRAMTADVAGHVQRVGTSRQFNVFEAGRPTTDDPLLTGTMSADYMERTIDALNL